MRTRALVRCEPDDFLAGVVGSWATASIIANHS